MSDEKSEVPNFFDEHGLQAVQHIPEIGQTYPIYGMITAIESTTDKNVIVIINFTMRAILNITEPDKVETLKQRAFEPGVFVMTITKINENADVTKENPIAYEGDVSTVIFGKKQTNYT